MPAPSSVLRHRDFRLLWLAASGSLLGDHLILTALALYVTDFTGSASDLGLVLTAQTAPLVLLLIPGGIVADRVERHRLLLATDVARGVVQATLALLVALDAAEIWHLVVAGVVFGSAKAFGRPAETGLVPQTVPDGEVQQAQALMGVSQNVAMIAGPAIGTGLVVLFSAAAAFAVDAATFAVSALLLAQVRPRDRSADRAAALAAALPAGPQRATGWRHEAREGWTEFRSRSWVWVTVAGACAAVLVGLGPLTVLGPTVSEREYGDTGFYGLVMTAFGAGAVIGAMTSMRWRPRHPLRAAHLAVALWPTIVLSLGLGAPLAVVLVLAVGGGWGISLFEVWWSTALAERIPPDSLSRVSAFDWMGSLALLPVSYGLAGPAADAFGLTEVLVVSGVLGTAIALVVLLSAGVRNLERLPEPDAESRPDPHPPPHFA